MSGLRSLPWNDRFRAGAFALATLSVVAGCHRAPPHEEAVRVGAKVVANASVSAPKELVAEGTLRRPDEVWPRLRDALGRRGRALPRGFPLAIAALSGFSPLVAGLLDGAAKVPFAILATPSGVSFVLGLRVTSGRELSAALTTGRDAAFTANADPVHGLSVLVPKRAPAELAVALSGDELLVASSREALELSGAYVAAAESRTPESGEVIELTSSSAALGGPVAALVDRAAEATRRELVTEDLMNRARHGGRAPDFAETGPVIERVAGLFEDVSAVVKSSRHLRVTADLLEQPARVRVELEPEDHGAARALVDDAEVGDATLLASLPADTRAALLWNRRPRDAAAPRSVLPLFGDRLSRADRARVSDLVDDVDRALGASAVLAVSDPVLAERAPAAFFGAYAAGRDGDAAAAGRAAGRLLDVLRTPAIDAPLRHFVGKVAARRERFDAAVAGGIAYRLLVSTDSGTDERRAPRELHFAAAARDDRTVAVLAETGAAARAAEILGGNPNGHVLGADPAIARAIVRAGHDAAALAMVRLPSAGTIATLIVGSDRKIAFAELTGGEPVFFALFGSLAE
jgi:hypothetical protein